MHCSGVRCRSLPRASRAAIGSSNPPATRPVADRQPVEVLPEAAAVQELVRQLHAIVYGYQLAIGKFKVFSKQRLKAERELLAQRSSGIG